VRDALFAAALVPLETAQLAAQVAELAAAVAERGNTNAVTDGAVAALMAEAACKGAALNVRINVVALNGDADIDAASIARGAQLVSDARAAIDAAAVHARLAESAAERAMRTV
jgi:formiminotetrahydrofolate cyclodeaminase